MPNLAPACVPDTAKTALKHDGFVAKEPLAHVKVALKGTYPKYN